MSASNQQETRRRNLFFAVALLTLVGAILFVRHRLRSDAADGTNASDTATHRTNLVLQAGKWLIPGTSNLFSGVLFDTYDSGATKSRSVVSNGLLEGLSQGWHTNGQQQIEEHFVAGTSHGLRTKWHANGQKLSEVTIVNGKLGGTFRSWHENGERAEEIELNDGQPNGPSKAWYASGYLKSQVTMSKGTVVTQQFWKDGEQREAGSPETSQLSSK
jgi:antitoxin component YwqK of YwqJK toxin-antitoxin module